MYTIESDMPLSAVKRKGRKGSKFPFDLMEIGDSFFVPNTVTMPNAAKSMASTVSVAIKRYSTIDPSGKTRINKAGKTVPLTVPTKLFTVRSVEEKGIKGARIWRTG